MSEKLREFEVKASGGRRYGLRYILSRIRSFGIDRFPWAIPPEDRKEQEKWNSK